MPGLESRVRGAAAVMLQREVPEHVNAAVAAAAASAGVPVLQDVGGEDRCSCSGSNPSPNPIPYSMLYCFPTPNPNLLQAHRERAAAAARLPASQRDRAGAAQRCEHTARSHTYVVRLQTM